jgi:hypothetical protein
MAWRHDGLRAGVASERRAARRTAWDKTIAACGGRAIGDGWAAQQTERTASRWADGWGSGAEERQSEQLAGSANRLKQAIMSAFTSPISHFMIHL